MAEAVAAYRRASVSTSSDKDAAVRLERFKKVAEAADRQKTTEGSWMEEAVQTIQRVLVGKS
ncbi:MAG: hypothetical protein AB7G48_10150 [Nitrospiraceae bacterium]